MKLKATLKFLALIFAAGLATSILNSCSTTGAEYQSPDPLQQQIRMQEEMSDVTRSFMR